MTLDLQHVSVSYGATQVLEGVSVSAESGSLLGLLGPNGSGKTTLLRAVMGGVDLDGGQIRLEGTDVATLSTQAVARQVGYLQQVSDVARQATVFDTVLLGRNPHFGWRPTETDREAVRSVLARLGIEDLSMRELGSLSGGQRRTVLLARALVQAESALLLDEPTSGLDLKHQYAVMRRVRRAVRERDLAGVVAIHDLALASQFCDRFALLSDGGLHAVGGDEVLDSATIEDVYDVPVSVVDRHGGKQVVPVDPESRAAGPTDGADRPEKHQPDSAATDGFSPPADPLRN